MNAKNRRNHIQQSSNHPLTGNLFKQIYIILNPFCVMSTSSRNAKKMKKKSIDLKTYIRIPATHNILQQTIHRRELFTITAPGYSQVLFCERRHAGCAYYKRTQEDCEKSPYTCLRARACMCNIPLAHNAKVVKGTRPAIIISSPSSSSLGFAINYSARARGGRDSAIRKAPLRYIY